MDAPTEHIPHDLSGSRLAREVVLPYDAAVIRELAMSMRAASWDLAIECIDEAIERDVLPHLRALGTIKRLANLPAFIGGLSMTLIRPRSSGRQAPGANPVLVRLARDHVIEREAAGFSAREIVQEFLLLRRVLWRFVRTGVARFDASTILWLEDELNSIIDSVIAECTVIYVDRATQELSEKSRRDSLTGLLNHQAFHNRLDEELDRCRRYDHELQVVYFDLDDFKTVNDTLGHGTGDRVIQIMSEVMNESIRDSDFAGRIGGDEFVICSVESNTLAAHLMIDRLRGRLAHRISIGTVPPNVGISAGCAGFPAEADTAQDLLVLADRRQYDDKRARKASR